MARNSYDKHTARWDRLRRQQRSRSKQKASAFDVEAIRAAARRAAANTWTVERFCDRYEMSLHDFLSLVAGA